MNNVILMGRLTRDPDVRWKTLQDGTSSASGRYTLAVDRIGAREGQQQADFVSCVTFGKAAEWAEKYLHQGVKIVIRGRIQTGSYTNRDGQKVYTTDVVVEAQEFAESKAANESYRRPEPDGQQAAAPAAGAAGREAFMNIPDDLDDADLPFN